MKYKVLKPKLIQQYFLFLVTFLISSQANALGNIIEQQTTGQTVSLIYSLIGIICILVIIPLLLLYFGAVKSNKHKQETSEHYRILDARSTGIMCIDEQGMIESANKTSASLIGTSQEELLGRQLTEFFDDEFNGAIKAGLAGEALTTKPMISETKQYVDLQFGDSFKQGDKFYRMLSLIGENAEGVSASLTAKSTSSNNDSEGNASFAEKRLAYLLENSPVAIGTLNNEHEITSANSILIDRLKFSEEELRKGNFYKLFSDPQEAGRMAKSLNSRDKLQDFHVKLMGKDGELYPGEITIQPIDDDDGSFLFWIINRSFEQFQRDKFDLLLENNPLPTCILTDDGFKRANKMACSFLGVKHERDLNELYPYSIELNENDTKAKELYEIVQAVKLQNSTKVVSWTHQINGVSIPTEITLSPVYKDHQLDSVLCSWTDHREIHKAVNAFKDLNKTHEQSKEELKSATNELEGALTQLQSKSDTLVDAEYEINILQQQVQTDQLHTEELENSLKELTENTSLWSSENEKLSKQLISAKDETVRLHSTYEARQQEYDKLQAELSKANESLEERQVHLKQLESVAHERLGQLDILEIKIDTLERNIAEKDRQLSWNNEQIERKDKDSANAQTENEKLNGEIQTLRIQLTETEKQYSENKKQYSEMKQELIEKSTSERNLQNQLDILESTATQEKASLAESNQELAREFSETDAALKTVEQKLAETLKAQEQEHQANVTNAKLVENISDELFELKQEVAGKDKELVVLEEQLDEQNRQRSEAQTQIDKLNRELETLKINAQETENHYRELEQRNAGIENELGEKSDLEKSLQSQLEILELTAKQEREGMLAAQQELNRELEKAKSDVKKVEQAAAEIAEEKNKEQSANSEKAQQLEATTNELSALKQQLAEKEDKLSALNEQLSEESEQKSAAQNTIDKLNQELQSLQIRVQETDNHYRELEQHSAGIESVLGEKSDLERSLQSQLQILEATAKQEKASLLATQQKLAEEYEVAKTQLKEAEVALKETSHAAQQEQQTSSQSSKQLQVVSDELEEFKQRSQTLEDELRSHNQSLNEKQNEIQTLKASYEESIEKVRVDNEALKQQIADNSQLQSQLEKDSQQQQNTHSQIEQSLQEANYQLTRLQQDIDDAEKEKEVLREQIAFKQQSEQDFEQRLTESQKAREALAKKLATSEQQKSTSSGSSAAPFKPKPLSFDVELPSRPELWFDLSKFWQELPPEATLVDSLSELVDKIEDHIEQADLVTDEENVAGIVAMSGKLMVLSKSIHSDPLNDLLQSFYNDCRLQMIDNALIRWAPTKTALQKSCRAVHEYLARV